MWRSYVIPSDHKMSEWAETLYRLQGEMEREYGEPQKGQHPAKLESLVRFAAQEANHQAIHGGQRDV